MGLDQYIFKEIEGQYEEDGTSKIKQIYYWRKNYELNDWACEKFCPWDLSDFNCERLALEEYMVDDLIKHIIFNLDKENKCEMGYEGIISQSILEAFQDCKLRIKNGETLYYYAWW